MTYNDAGQVAARLDVVSWKKRCPIHHCQMHVIHPIALDAVFHWTIAALAKGGWQPVPTMVPTIVGSLWISGKLRSDTDEGELELLASKTFQGCREAEFSVLGQDLTTGECLISLQGYRGTTISSLESTSQQDRDSMRLGFKIEWQPDWTTFTNENMARYCEIAADHCIRPSQQDVEELEFTCYKYLSMALSEMQATPHFGAEKQNLKRYLGWTQRQGNQFRAATCFAGRPEDENLLLTVSENNAALSTKDQRGSS